MDLRFAECTISIDEKLIKCSYVARFKYMKWSILLDDSEICYVEDDSVKKRFKTEDIKDLQFEMINGGNRYEDIPACSAYIILNGDTDPKEFFYLLIAEKYTLLNQTHAHDFCKTILEYISKRYNIPSSYKLSIATKKKENMHGFVIWYIWLIFILICWFISRKS